MMALYLPLVTTDPSHQWLNSLRSRRSFIRSGATILLRVATMIREKSGKGRVAKTDADLLGLDSPSGAAVGMHTSVAATASTVAKRCPAFPLEGRQELPRGFPRLQVFHPCIMNRNVRDFARYMHSMP